MDELGSKCCVRVNKFYLRFYDFFHNRIIIE